MTNRHENAPLPISGDECLLPGGPRIVTAPAVGWTQHQAKQPQSDGMSWVYAAIGTAGIVGMMLTLLVLAIAFRIGAVGLVVQHKQPRVEQPAMAASSELREGPGGSGEAAKP